MTSSRVLYLSSQLSEVVKNSILLETFRQELSAREQEDLGILIVGRNIYIYFKITLFNESHIDEYLCYFGVFILFISGYFLKNLFILCIYFWLRWVFAAVRGLSLVAASGGHSSLLCVGFSLQWLRLLWSMGSRHAGSVVVAHGL